MKHPVQLKTELIPQEFDPDRLDQITNVVLAYHPKIKTKAAKRRARRNKRASKVQDKPKSRERTI